MLIGNEYIMESTAIAEKLESLFPSPSLHLDSPILPKTRALFNKVLGPLHGSWMPGVATNLLPPRSKEFFDRTRAERLGKPLSQVSEEFDLEEGFKKATPALQELAALLKETEGPYFMGTEVSYADFVAAGSLEFLKVIDASVYARMVKIEPSLGEFYDACKPWLARNDH